MEGLLYLSLYSFLSALAFTAILCSLPGAWRSFPRWEGVEICVYNCCFLQSFLPISERTRWWTAIIYTLPKVVNAHGGGSRRGFIWGLLSSWNEMNPSVSGRRCTPLFHLSWRNMRKSSTIWKCQWLQHVGVSAGRVTLLGIQHGKKPGVHLSWFSLKKNLKWK